MVAALPGQWFLYGDVCALLPRWFPKGGLSVVIMVIVLFFSRGIMGDKEISFTGMIRKLRKRKAVPAVADEGKEGEQR